MRLWHSIKNILIFAPLFASRALFDGARLRCAALGFLSFTFMASTVYVINDVYDRNRDAMHLKKKNRPIASGQISARNAKRFAAVLIVFSLGFNFLTSGWKLPPLLALLTYFFLNVLYSRIWKHIPLADLASLSFCYIIRVLYGGLITEVSVSGWMYLTVMAGAFTFGIGKRRNELRKDTAAMTRPVTQAYTQEFLSGCLYVCITLMNVYYSIWTLNSDAIQSTYGPVLAASSCFVLMLISFQYVLCLDRDGQEDPVEILLNSKTLLALCTVFAALLFAVLYL